MIRIFTALAGFALALTCVTLRQGFGVVELRGGQTAHFLLGLVSALSVMLVGGIVVTYFIGTSRWCKEVVETYSLDESLIRRSTLLKRRTFPWALVEMLVMIGMVASGAAADPANTLVAATSRWASIHLPLSVAGTALLATCFIVQGINLRSQHAVIAEILAEVRRIRVSRGLEV